MDMIGDIIDWVLIQVMSMSGASAAELRIDNTMLGAVQGVWDYFIIVGIGLTIIYFIAELNKQWAFEGQTMSLKTMFAPFFKFVIAIILMANAANIFGAIATFNNTFADWSETAMTSTMPDTCSSCGGKLISDNIKNCPYCGAELSGGIGQTFVDNLGFWEKIIMLFPIIITFAVILICNLVWVYKALCYKVELLARVAFAPIALADCYNGFNANAVRYIKGTIALILYGGTLILLPKLTVMIAMADLAAMMNDLTTSISVTGVFDVILAYVKFIIAPIAAIGISGAAKTLTKEAVGA